MYSYAARIHVYIQVCSYVLNVCIVYSRTQLSFSRLDLHSAILKHMFTYYFIVMRMEKSKVDICQFRNVNSSEQCTKRRRFV